MKKLETMSQERLVEAAWLHVSKLYVETKVILIGNSENRAAIRELELLRSQMNELHLYMLELRHKPS